MVIKGSDLDALSDDPTELQNELQALAGPAAGPNGGQIYIDGFEGGQIPPKSAILEIRVNQNPFSAEYDRIGYGRIEIITKPGSQKLQGSINSFGNDSGLNTGNPLITVQPSYYLYSYSGNISGPITKTSSYFFNGFTITRQNSNIVDALNPATLNSNITEAFPAPMNFFNLNPRVDFQLTKNNFISIRDLFQRYSGHGNGVGTLSLPEQIHQLHQLRKRTPDRRHLGHQSSPAPGAALSVASHQQQLRCRVSSLPQSPCREHSPTAAAASGTVQDHEDVFMLAGLRHRDRRSPHPSLRRARPLLSRRQLLHHRRQRQLLLLERRRITRPTRPRNIPPPSSPIPRPAPSSSMVRVFAQDDWRVNKSFLLGLGLRYEGQNFIHDHADWAPRLALPGLQAIPERILQRP